MIVFIDLSFLGDGRITGIERFSLEIYKKLKNSTVIEYHCLLPAKYKDINEDVTNIFMSTQSKMVGHILLVAYLFKSNAEILYLPAFPASPLVWVLKRFRKKLKVCRVLHDVVPWSQKETLPLKAKLYFKPLEEYGLKRATKVFTVSKYSASEIKKYLNVNVDRVIYNGVSSIFRGTVTKEIDENINILSVGTIEPRKNYTFLIDLLEFIIKKYPKATLTICGRKGWGYNQLIDHVETKSYKSSIKILTDISDADLDQQYKKAHLFLYSSIEEGFGIPLVEAMSYGIPIIAAEGSAITEVVSEAGILIHTNNIEDWTSKIGLMIDNELIYTKYVTASVERSKYFKWENSAKLLEREFLNA